MKKIFTALAAVFALALVGVMSSCVQNYEGQYPELTQYYCCWSDPDAGSDMWYNWTTPSKTLMTYDSGAGVYKIEIETKRKNEHFEITKGATYDVYEYCYFNKNKETYHQDEANQAVFGKTVKNGFGSFHTVLPKPAKYVITFNAKTEKYSVAEK